ncbi:cold shock domain-containing protein [Streptomyces pactum]|uniref:Cold shock domain-containing protein n=1 Tax=Streptomyces pactum TaxID=68249 RepID=A0ABS0NU46_9ACTN|nr:cold shock domain-containing protein [Streptomyces pactum]MBH5338597.1 cold shock domain-containing protein [Streptomyces pactum]
MTTGKVVRFDEIRGYGFIAPDNGTEDVFMHVNDLLDDKYLFRPGLRVSFAVEEGERGPKASDVRIIEQLSPVPAVRPSSALSTVVKATGDADDSECDLLSVAEFRHELTEALLKAVPTLTAAQLLQVRGCVDELARAHRWIDQ